MDLTLHPLKVIWSTKSLRCCMMSCDLASLIHMIKALSKAKLSLQRIQVTVWLSPFLLLMSPIHRSKWTLAIRLGAWVEHPDIYKCLLEKVSAYFSRTLNKPEKQYCITQKKLLTIIKAVKHFHHYLYGRPFVIRTGHSALQWLFNLESPRDK